MLEGQGSLSECKWGESHCWSLETASSKANYQKYISFSSKKIHLNLNFENGLIRGVINNDIQCCFSFTVTKSVQEYSFLQKRAEEN